MRQLTALFLTLFAFLSCADHKTGAILSSADSLMEKGVDSARHALLLLDSVERECGGMGRSLQMRLELLRAKAMNKGYVDFTTDSIMKEVVEYYDSHGSENDRMLAHYLLGCVYRDLGESLAAIDEYDAALEVADTTSTGCDYKLLSRILQQKGSMYELEMLPENALEAYKLSERCATLASDTLTALLAEERQVSTLIFFNKLDEIEKRAEALYKRYREHGYYTEAARCLGIIIQPLILNGKYEKAKLYNDIYRKDSGFFDDGEDNDSKNSFHYYCNGLYCLGVGSDSSIVHFRKAFALAATLRDKSSAAYGLFLYYSHKHNTDSIIKYANLCHEYQEESFSEQEKKNIVRYMTTRNYNRYKNLAVLKQHEAELYHNTLVWSTILIFSVILLLVVVLRNRIVSERKRKKMELRELQIMVDSKESELSILKKTLSMTQIEKANCIDQIRENEETISSIRHDLYVLTKEMKINEGNVPLKSSLPEAMPINLFRILADKGKIPTVNQWKLLEKMMNDYHPGFCQSLGAKKSLSENEYRICILLRLGFELNSIRQLMDMSASNVSNIRKRMSEKIFCELMSPKAFDKRIREIM